MDSLPSTSKMAPRSNSSPATHQDYLPGDKYFYGRLLQK